MNKFSMNHKYLKEMFGDMDNDAIMSIWHDNVLDFVLKYF